MSTLWRDISRGRAVDLSIRSQVIIDYWQGCYCERLVTPDTGANNYALGGEEKVVD